jgi:hypothetical protein
MSAGSYHVKVSFYTAAWSPVCDKSQDVTVQSSTPPLVGCDAVTITPATSSINLGGLTAPVVTVQAFNNSWSTVYNQTFTNSPGSVIIPSLSSGTYHVKVIFSNASWAFICEKAVDATVASGASPNTFAATATESAMIRQPTRVTLLSSNPIKESIKLRIELERAQKVVISILDIQGRTLYTRAASYSQGVNEVLFTTGRLPAGSYLLRVTSDAFTEAKKIIRQ